MAKSKQAKKNSNSSKSGSKSTGQKKGQASKNRGAVLTVLLVLIVLHGILATILAYSSLKADYEDARPWVLGGLTLLSIADVVAAIGMWFWKKWAIYVYAIASLAAMAIHLMLTGSLLIVFHDILPLAILGYVINLQSKRDLFE